MSEPGRPHRIDQGHRHVESERPRIAHDVEVARQHGGIDLVRSGFDARPLHAETGTEAHLLQVVGDRLDEARDRRQREADLVDVQKSGKTVVYRLKLSVLEDALLGFASAVGVVSRAVPVPRSRALKKGTS